jgi:hypothetical protein
MTDRFISGIVTSLCLIVTCGLAALLLAFYRGGMSLNWSATLIWLGAVSGIGFVAGFIMGTERATEMLAQLWGTADTRKPLLMLTLWGALISLWLLSYWFIRSNHFPTGA